MLNARNLFEFDNVVTAPLHGYRDVQDYWHRASARLVLNDICVPTLVLNAKNDPSFLRAFCRIVRPLRVRLEYPEHGGHVALPASLPRQIRLATATYFASPEQHG